jgi:large repetitive protein
MSDEFTVNTYEEAWQDGPRVQSFADGSFVIMWRSFNQEFDTYYVGAQRYDRFGLPIGGELVLDGEQGSASEISGITRLKDGGFVIVFAYSFDGLLDQDQAYAKVYNADFTLRTSRIKVDTVPDFQSINANVAALGDGGFMVFYDSDEARRTQDDIYAQRFDRNGVKIGGNVLVNTREKEFDQNAVEIAQLKNGNVLAIWHSEASFPTPGDLDSNEIRGTIYGSKGQVLRADFSLADASGSVGDGIDPYEVTELNNGGFALVRYETEAAGRDFTYDVKLRLFNGAGNSVTNEITVTKETRGIIYSVNVAQLVTGEIVVVWETPSKSDFPYNDVQFRALSMWRSSQHWVRKRLRSKHCQVAGSSSLTCRSKPTAITTELLDACLDARQLATM